MKEIMGPYFCERHADIIVYNDDTHDMKRLTGECLRASLEYNSDTDVDVVTLELRNTNLGGYRAISSMVPKRIVRNGPAMVVFWNDDTKTVVKCHEEEFDYEKGLAMALARKMWGRSRTLAYLKKVEEQ